MKSSFAAKVSAAILVASLSAAVSHAGVIMHVWEDGPDLLVSFDGGTLDLTGLTLAGGPSPSGAPPSLRSVDAPPQEHYGMYYGFGASSYFERYDGPITTSASPGWTGSTASSDGVVVTPGSSLLGAELGVAQRLIIYTGSSSGWSPTETFDAEARFANRSLSDHGLTANESFTFSWAGDSFAVMTSAPVVAAPEASEALVFLVGMTGLLGTRRRKGRSA